MVSLLARFLRENRELSALIICALISLTLLALASSVKNAVSFVISTPILGPVKRAASGAVELVRVRRENAVLRQLTVRLMEERSSLLASRHENERLRELTGFLIAFEEEERFEMLPASVVGMPGGRVLEGIEIDRGLEHGVAVGMPVIAPEGLIGKISRTYPGRALIEPLTSAASAVAVTVERSRIRGIVRPRYRSASELVSWEMDYVAARSDIRTGDQIVTSGLGGVYPPGLVVGRVSNVTEGPLTMAIAVELAAEFATTEQVFVVTGRAETQPGRGDRLAEIARSILASEPGELSIGQPQASGSDSERSGTAPDDGESEPGETGDASPPGGTR